MTGDELLVRRAARGIAVQTALLVGAVVLLLSVLVTVVVVRGQEQATDDLLRGTIATADDVGDPPAGSWLLLSADGSVRTTPGFPADLLADLEPLRVKANASVQLVTVEGSYRVATARRAAEVVQVVTGLDQQHAQRDRLLRAMGVAALLGLAAAAAIGVLLGRRAVRPLAQALALQQAFVADASHELRTPLTLLSTRAQLLDRAVQNGQSGAQVQADSRGVVEDVQRLGEVVEDLLVAADPHSQQDRTTVALAALAATVVDSAGAHAASADVRLSLDVHEDIDVAGSTAALRRAVLSLVDNAVDHTPAGGQVTVTVRRSGRHAVVAVSDTGPGVDPADAPHVLRRFHSGGQRSGRAHYGLGLALTRDVADRHGGQLRLAASDRGATFELVLPALR